MKWKQFYVTWQEKKQELLNHTWVVQHIELGSCAQMFDCHETDLQPLLLRSVDEDKVIQREERLDEDGESECPYVMISSYYH